MRLHTIFIKGRIVDVEELKASVIGEVEAHCDQLNELSLRIHSNPELGFQEIKAASWLTQYLETNGFSVKDLRSPSPGICRYSGPSYRFAEGVCRPLATIGPELHRKADERAPPFWNAGRDSVSFSI